MATKNVKGRRPTRTGEYFADSMQYEAPEPHHKMCGKWGVVSLQQRGRDSFAVRYGMQIRSGLSYARAAEELGACLMHQLACDGRLDNREVGED